MNFKYVKIVALFIRMALLESENGCNKSDFFIGCIRRDYCCAYTTLKYLKRQKKLITNL